MMKHICIHPQKVFIQSWINFTQMVKSKTWGYVNKEIGIQNIKRWKKINTTGIYTMRTIENTDIGGGTYTEE